MEKLEIKYPNGQMTVNVTAFFPCLTKTARKLYPYIKRYCSSADRAELGRHLGFLVAFYKAQVESGGKERGDVPYDWNPGDCRIRQRERETALRRAKANYKLYCQMEVDDEWMK